jgi:hypothetical protein
MSRLIFILVFSLTVTVAYGQTYKFKTKYKEVAATMNQAINNADKFIQSAIASDIFEKHFQFNSYQSRLRNDTLFHLVTFDDSINFVPKKYEVMYAVVIGGDTLTDQFKIPIDSLGNVTVDTTSLHYIWDDIKAYNKLLTGQYKFDYAKLKQLIKVKNLKNYSIVFMNSISTINYKNYKTLKVFTHYWYVTEFKKGGYTTTYTIDPDTGKVTKQNAKMKMVARAKRHVTFGFVQAGLKC